MGGARGQAGGDGALHGAKGQELWVNMGAKPPYPLCGERKMGGTQRQADGDGALMGQKGMDYRWTWGKAPYPLTEGEKWEARGGRRAATGRCMG